MTETILTIYPDKLKPGDEIRVIAPSRSLSLISEETRKYAVDRFEAFGLNVSYSKNCEQSDQFMSSSIESRVEDLHEAFRDENVKGIFTVIGGYNVNQILDELDYDLIASNPKVLCGFSDITALGNAIFAKTGLVTYSGPHYSSMGMKKGLEYTKEYLQKCLMGEAEFKIEDSDVWSDEAWFLDQENRTFIENTGTKVFNTGRAEGRIVGGNLCTFNLLQGTDFMPELTDTILFIEDDSLSDAMTFDRDLQSLIHQPGFDQVKGIVIGRFQKEMDMTPDVVRSILSTKKALRNLPIIFDADFGHTTPIFTFPIGGTCRMNVGENEITLVIEKH